MPGQEDGEGEVGIAHHQGIGAGIDELQAVEPRDPKTPRIPQGFADSVGDQTKLVVSLEEFSGLMLKNVDLMMYQMQV